MGLNESLTKDINEIKRENIEQLFLIIKYSCSTFINYLLSSPKNKDAKNACIGVIREYIRIMKVEKNILNFLLEHIDYIDENRVDDLINKLDRLNIQTINYFYEYLDSIEYAIILNQPHRLIQNKNFEFITERKDYQNEACELLFNFDFIKAFLDYEIDFWDFIEPQTFTVEKASNCNVTWNYDRVKMQYTIKVDIVKITDIKSVIVNIKTFSKAYNIYNTIFNNKVNAEKYADEKFEKYYLKQKNKLIGN